MGPNSVVTLTGPEHLRQRRLLLPPFHGERMREYEELIEQSTRAEMSSWPVGSPMRVQPSMRRITLEVILRAVFGVQADRMAPMREAIGALLAPGQTLAMVRAAFRPPSLERPKGRFGEALDRLDAVVYQEISRRRRAGDLQERSDILSLLMLARDEQGRPMGDEELRDELVTLLLAGHETTATSAAWAIERLVRHPAALERLLAEVDAAAGESYMDAVISETMRVRPVVPLVVRVLDGRARGRLLQAARRDTGRSLDLPDEPQPQRLRGAARVPPGALPRPRPRHVLVDPVRGRNPALHRSLVRADGDARDPEHGPRRAAPAPGARDPRAAGRADPPAGDHPRARTRHEGSLGATRPVAPRDSTRLVAGGSWPGVKVASLSCTHRR